MNSPQSSTQDAFGNAFSNIDETVEVRFSPFLLNAITGALLFGGVVACALMWFLSASQPSTDKNLLRLAGVAVLLTDVMCAVFLRIYFSSFVVRADERGVSKRSGLGDEEFASWEEIARFETRNIAGRVAGFTLFDAENKELLHVRPNTKPPLDQSKIVALVEKKLAARR